MILEYLNVFRKIDVKFDEIWLVNRKYFIEVEASLLELALNLNGLYKYWVKFEEKRVRKLILLWVYCKTEKRSLKNSEKKLI